MHASALASFGSLIEFESASDRQWGIIFGGLHEHPKNVFLKAAGCGKHCSASVCALCSPSSKDYGRHWGDDSTLFHNGE